MIEKPYHLPLVQSLDSLSSLWFLAQLIARACQILPLRLDVMRLRQAEPASMGTFEIDSFCSRSRCSGSRTDSGFIAQEETSN
jgi:hypothetical protein